MRKPKITPIKGSYADRMFSYDVAGLEHVQKIENDDFTPLIEKALQLPEANIESQHLKANHLMIKPKRPHTVLQQGSICRMVNIRFDHGRIDPQFARSNTKKLFPCFRMYPSVFHCTLW